ncbi:MAG: peptidase M16 [Phycisphaerales bacterium]|nr:MAG: peptidase M16 [Phycisphaerales bacterium]
MGVRTSLLSATFVGQDLDKALPLLVDSIVRPNLDAQDFEPARSLALQELQALADDPEERAGVEAMARHHPEPFNRSSYGSVQGLQACTHADAVAFHRARYVPGGSVIALAGDVDPARARRVLEDAFQGWSGRAEAPAPSGPARRGTTHLVDDSAQVQVVVVREAPPDGGPSAACERLACAILSGGMSGRLFTEVREKRGLCYAVHAAYTPESPTGWLTAYVGTTPERAGTSLEVLLAELDRLATPDGAPTAEELERARVGLKSRLVFGGESTAARAGALANDYRRLGRCRSLEDRLAEVDAVTLEGLRGHLNGFADRPQTVLTLGPASESLSSEPSACTP